MESHAVLENHFKQVSTLHPYYGLSTIVKNLNQTNTNRTDLTGFLQDIHSKLQSSIDILSLEKKSDTPEIEALNKAYSILLGAIIFAAESIAKSYKVLSPLRSRLYRELYEKIIKPANNPIDDMQKLIYIYSFYQFAQLYPTKLTEPANIDQQFQPIIDFLLQAIPDIKIWLTKRPEVDTLISQAKLLPTTFTELCKNKYFFQSVNIAHVKYTLLIKLITDPKLENLFKELSKIDDVNSDAFKQVVYTTLFGALLYIMNKIEKECEGTLFYPANDELYKMCQKALNIDHTNDIPNIFKITYYADFRKFVAAVNCNEDLQKILQGYQLAPAGYVFNATLFDDAEEFLDTLLSDIKKILTADSFALDTLKSLLNFAMLSLLGIACWEVGSIAFSVGIGRGAIIKIGSEIGGAMFGFLGKIAANTFAAQHEKTIIIKSIATPLEMVTMRIYNALGHSPPLKSGDSTAAIKVRDEIKSEIGKTNTIQFNVIHLAQLQQQQMLYKALVLLPSTLLSSEIKERIHQAILEPTTLKLAEVSDEKQQTIRPGVA